MTTGRKTGGRKPGSKNVVGERVRLDVLAAYRSLGGVVFLKKWAKEHPDEFVEKCLLRLLPPAQPLREEIPVATAEMVDQLSIVEAARRVAFALAKGAHAVQELEMAPKIIDTVPEPTLPLLDSIPTPAQLFSVLAEQQAQPEQHPADTLEIYTGSSAEQGSRRKLI